MGAKIALLSQHVLSVNLDILWLLKSNASFIIHNNKFKVSRRFVTKSK